MNKSLKIWKFSAIVYLLRLFALSAVLEASKKMKLFPYQQIRNIFFKKHNLGKCEIISEVGKVSEDRWTVPDNIIKPPYYEKLNQQSQSYGTIEIKNDEQIAGMRESCKLAANILKKCGNILKVFSLNQINLNQLKINFFLDRNDDGSD